MFESRYVDEIFKKTYVCSIPDHLTLDDDYIRIRGVPTSHNRVVADMMSTSFIDVRITIVEILNYFMNGIEVRIPTRDKLIEIHTNIEGYLTEWRSYLQGSINSRHTKYTDMLNDLEAMSKSIYNRLNKNEVATKITRKEDIGFGMRSLLFDKLAQNQVEDKPDYDGISKIIKSKRPERLDRY